MESEAEIKVAVAEWLTAYRNLNPEKHSFNYIAIKTKTAKSFIERLAKNQLGDHLDPDKILSVTHLVAPCEEDKRKVAEFFANHFLCNSSDIYKDALYARFVKENNQEAPPSLEVALRDEELGVAYPLIAAMNKSPFKTIQRYLEDIFGGAAERIFNKLKEEELISLKEDKVEVIKENYSPSFETIKKRLPILARLYKTSNIGKKLNYVFILTGGMDEQGMAEAQEAYRKFQAELMEIRARRPGRIPAFFVGFMDLFNNKKLDLEKGE